MNMKESFVDLWERICGRRYWVFSRALNSDELQNWKSHSVVIINERLFTKW